MTEKRRSIWPVLIVSVLAAAFLCALGAWQLNRLSEKEMQIAALKQRMSAPPASLTDLMQRFEQGEDIEFTRVLLTGKLDHAAERLKISTNKGSAAWQVLTPMMTKDGVFLFVDRGVVPENQRDSAGRSSPADIENLAGIVRLHNGGQGYFDPENNVEQNIWFWWDIPAMLSSVTIPLDAKVAPFIVQRLAAPDETGIPEAAEPKVALKNNHLGYAITWFGLALVTLAMGLAYMISLLKARKA